MPHRRPRRVYHHISLAFATPENVTPQLWEWVTNGFPAPVSVYQYSMSTRFPSLPAFFQISPSSSSQSDSMDPDANDSLLEEFDADDEKGGSASESEGLTDRSSFTEGRYLTPWEDLESYVTTSESSVEDLRRRLRRIARSPSPELQDEQGEGEGEEGVAEGYEMWKELGGLVVRNPWTTWFPPTPPLGARDIEQTGATLSPLFLTPAATPLASLHRERSFELDTIDEYDTEVVEHEQRQELEREQGGVLVGRAKANAHNVEKDAQVNGSSETLPAEELPCWTKQRHSREGTSMCWVCRALLQRQTRRHNLVP